MTKRKRKKTPHRSPALKAVSDLGRYKALAQMIGGFVHQLRTPIHIIQASMEGLIEGTLSTEAKTQADMISRSAQRLEASVNSLLSFVKGEKLPLHPGSLNEVVEHLQGFLKVECQKRQVTIEKNLASQRLVLLDDHSLQEALINFLMNALQAMPRGGVLSIKTEDLQDVRKVRLEIRDTGSGMDSKTLARLSTPFHTTKREGVGLGVFFARKVLKRHHARLTFSSEKGNGTTVRIVFPAA
jgi:signal transduction histidine kinase